MKFLKSHLLEKVPMKIDTLKLESELTRLGLEVDSVEKHKNKSDVLFDLDLTPNRGDCFSVHGIARELAAVSNKKVKKETNALKASKLSPKSKVKISEKAACPRYSFIEIYNLDNTKKLPNFIKERLEAGGINSINPVVDILNYVMLDLGQPLHAFDLNKIGKNINVRFAKSKEKIQLLDESLKVLNDKCLVISDEKEPLALAGVMGGIKSSVSAATNSVFIESAFFVPKIIRGKARNFNIQTDSSQRFERGVDYNLQSLALIKATNLINKYLSGTHSKLSTVENKSNLPRQNLIDLNLNHLNNKLGFEIKLTKLKKFFDALEFKIESNKKNFLKIKVPSHRFDLEIEEDLVEEIARLEGYDNIPSIDLKTSSSIFRNSIYLQTLNLKKYIANQGFQEVINYSFVNKKSLQDLDISKELIQLKNPLNENLEVMRTSLLPGLLKTLKSNLSRGESFMKIFEEGKVFTKSSSVREQNMLSGLIFDQDKKKNWSNKKQFSFFDLKKFVVDLLTHLSAKEVKFQASKNAFFHPNISLDVLCNGKLIGSFGKIHPKICKLIEVKKGFFYFEFFTNELAFKDNFKINESSKFPSIQRDLSFLVPNHVNFDDINKLIFQQAGKDLISLKLFDLYENKEVKNSSSSFAINMTWQSKTKTLEDKAIDLITLRIVKKLEENLGIHLRR